MKPSQESPASNRIELDRRYRVSGDYFSSRISIDELLSLKGNNVSVILGDKGSGKTTEIYQAAENRKKENPGSVLIYRLEECLKMMTQADKITAWNAYSGIRYLFLDSVDECRLGQTQSSDDLFEQALNNLGGQLKISSETKIIITSRVAEWQKVEDENRVVDFFERTNSEIAAKIKASKEKNADKQWFNHENAESIEPYHVFEIQEMKSHQVKRLAEKFYTSTAESRLSGIRNLPSFFYGTPVEALDTLRYIHYLADGEIDEMEFLRVKLQSRYRELNARYRNNERLTMKQVEAFTQRAAIASLLCKTLSFRKRRYYRHALEADANTVISLEELFPESEIADINNFADSTLFISNGQCNRIKFYNESIRDYAAFRWLQSQLASRPYRDICKLLFNQSEAGECYPKENFVLPIIMLANTDRRMQHILMKNSPDLLIKHSQYAQFLNEQDKIAVLDVLFKKYPYRLNELMRDTGYGEEAFSYYFSKDAILVDYLMPKLSESQSEFEVAIVYHLLCHQQVDKLTQDVKSRLISYIERDLDAHSEEIVDALISLFFRLQPSPSQFVSFKKKLFLKKITRNTVYDSFFDRAYPNYLDTEAVMDQLFRVQEIGYKLASILEGLFKHNDFNDDELRKAITHLESRCEHLESRCEYCLGLIVSLVIEAIKRNFELDQITAYLYKIYRRIITLRHSSTSKNPAIKRLRNKLSDHHTKALLTHLKDEFLREPSSSVFDHYYYFRDDNILSHTQIINLMLDLSICPSLEDSITVKFFRFALSYSDIYQIDIKKYANNPSKVVLLSQRKEQISKEQEEARIRAQPKREDLENHNKNIQDMLDKLDDIKSGDFEKRDCLISLFKETVNNSQWGEWKIEVLVENTNQVIADAFCEGMRQLWIKSVDIFSATDEYDKDLAPVILLSINLSYSSIKDKFWNEAKYARVALRFGLHEMNGLPHWYDEMRKLHPREAESIIKPYILENVGSEAYMFFKPLYKLKSCKKQFYYNLVYKTLIESVDITRSNFIISFLYLASHPLADVNILTELITSKCSLFEEAEHLPTYVHLINLVNPDEFISTLKRLKKEGRIDASFLNRFDAHFDSFHEEYSSITNQAALHNWDYLQEFTKIWHSVKGCNYDNERDEQNFNGYVSIFDRIYSSLISNLPAENDWTQVAKDRAQVEKLCAIYPSRNLGNLLLAKMDSVYYQNNSNPWREDEIIRYEERGYLEPKCSNDLFEIVVSKFKDIKHDNEAADYSNREPYKILANSKDDDKRKKRFKESIFQKQMLMELRLRSNELYSAVREVEVYNDKKPDLQIWHRSFVVNIECKIVDSWSYKELREAIKEQLVGQYLKHERNTHGILLLARVAKKHWVPAGKTKINYEQLLTDLQAYAKEFTCSDEAAYAHIQKIEVIALDYYLPEKKR